MKIDSFRGQYEFLSNFYAHPFTYDGLAFENAEAAFQSAKTTNPKLRQHFVDLNPSQAKRFGRSIDLRPDWERIKDGVMLDVLRAKFSDPALKERLLATGDADLIEGTTGWHDNYWGNCECEKCVSISGKNVLGKLLMRVRTELCDEAG